MNKKIIDPLDDFRQSIDNLDTALIFLLAERCRIITKVALIKTQKNIPFEYSEEREGDLKKTFDIAKHNNLDINFISKLFQRIYKEALNIIKQSLKRNNLVETKFTNLERLRLSIYHLDLALCHILAERFQVVLQVREYKKEKKISALVTERWHELLNQKKKLAKALGVDINFTADLFTLIHEESLRIQENEK